MAFSFIDADGSGKLSAQEIREKLGSSINQQRFDELLKQFDKNNDGEISKYEFRDMMMALAKKSSAIRKNSGFQQALIQKTKSTNIIKNKDPGILKRSSNIKNLKR